MKKQLLLVVLSASLLFGAGALHAQSNDAQPQDQREKRHGFKKPRFTDLDLDGDSFITLAEFMEKPIPHGDHQTIFGHIDADGNGEITQDEFDSHRPPGRSKNTNSGRGRG